MSQQNKNIMSYTFKVFDRMFSIEEEVLFMFPIQFKLILNLIKIVQQNSFILFDFHHIFKVVVSINKPKLITSYNQFLQVLKQPKNHKQMFQIYNQYSSMSKPKQILNVVLISPSKNQTQQIQGDENLYKFSEQTSFFLPQNLIFQEHQQAEKNDEDSKCSSSSDENKHSTISDVLGQERQRKRKNKEEKHKEIQEKKKDDGRGGNCIASNISKTLGRIIESILKKQVFYNFKAFLSKYKIKSQKQNTIILLLLLYVLAKQGKIHTDTLDSIFQNFLKSLRESESNCDKKLRSQQSRRSFHLKNRKMYTRFIEINHQIYTILRANLIENSAQSFSLNQLQNIISDTYDRKQREIQKAMNKIKSLILNHKELKQLFAYQENDIEQIFFESIDYSYRRNLPKRCKQIKSKVKQIFTNFERVHNIKSEQDKYMICYMALELIEDKREQIWEEFIKNTHMKNQFNKTPEEMKKLEMFLENQLPKSFKNLQQAKKSAQKVIDESKQQHFDCKIEEESSTQITIQNLFNTYEQIKNSEQY